MFINSLIEYAKIHPTDKIHGIDGDIPDGWAETNIDYRIIISYEGNLLSIIPTKEFVDNNIIVYPIQTRGTTDNPTVPSILETGIKYILGIVNKDGRLHIADTIDKPVHRRYVEHELTTVFSATNSPMTDAYRKFLTNWKAEDNLNNPIIVEFNKNCKEGITKQRCGISVECFSNYLENDEDFKQSYINYYNNLPKNPIIVDSITGELGESIRIHCPILLKGTSSGGCSIIQNFKSSSSESYGFEGADAYNSYITKKTMYNYYHTLSQMLRNKHTHTTLNYNNTTYIHFTTADDRDDEEDHLRDSDVSGIMHNLFRTSDVDDIVVNEFIKSDDNFYIFEIEPNEFASGSRISIKNHYCNSFNNFVNNINNFQRSLQINTDSGRKNITVDDIIKSMISPKDYIDKKVDEEKKLRTLYKLYASTLINNIINNGSIPHIVFQTLVDLLRKEMCMSDDIISEFNKHNKFNEYSGFYITSKKDTKKVINISKHSKHNILKFAELIELQLRIVRYYINHKYNREVLNMNLSPTEVNKPFIWGELFALYERLQEVYFNYTKKTISRDFYLSASELPLVTFNILNKKSINYTDDKTMYILNDINEYINNLCSDGYMLPNKFSTEETALFIAGYAYKQLQIKKEIKKKMTEKKCNTDKTNVSELHEENTNNDVKEFIYE